MSIFIARRRSLWRRIVFFFHPKRRNAFNQQQREIIRQIVNQPDALILWVDNENE